jgi:hypothetical protein
MLYVWGLIQQLNHAMQTLSLYLLFYRRVPTVPTWSYLSAERNIGCDDCEGWWRGELGRLLGKRVGGTLGFLGQLIVPLIVAQWSWFDEAGSIPGMCNSESAAAIFVNYRLLKDINLCLKVYFSNQTQFKVDIPNLMLNKQKILKQKDK